MKKLIKLFVLVFAFTLTLNANTGFPKEYYKLSGKAAKQYFFDYLTPMIEKENLKILEERNFIKSLNNNTNLDTNSSTYKYLQDLQKKYKIKKIYDYKRFLQRIDIVPPSMAIAQAATESGWGKSRFVKVANNIFGHWTYNPKIGVVPLKRPKGKKHLIRKFSSLQASIAAYMLNLNRTGAYSKFRLQREQYRNSNKVIDGLKLSKTMDKYSGIGHDYTKILSSIIRKSKLQNYDKKFYEMTKENE